jgi:predicted porin
MKNKIIAAAVAAMVVPAVASAADSDLQIYGIADAYIGIDDDDRAGGDGGLVVGSGGQSTSRLGVKGSEDLGGGLTAIFQFEAPLTVDNGTAGGLTFVRRSYVGMKGGFGKVTVGRDYTPLFWVLIDNDVARFGHDTNDANLGQANRTSNGVNYEGKFGALKVNAVYAANEVAGGDDIVGVGVRYNAGSWRVGAGFHDEAGTDVFGLGAQVNFGGFKVGFNFVDDDANPDSNFGLSLGTKIGAAGDVVVNFKDRNDQTEYQIYYRQSMSKRTNWYVGYSDEDAAGTSLRAGVRHRF